MTYVPALDGLRAIAVLAVIAYHCGWFPQGYRGVDLFFVLSGFLITRLLVAEYDRHGGVSLRSFYARRALRLLPALVPVLAVVGGGFLWRAPSWRTAAYLAGVASYLGNYVIGWLALRGPLDHFWSLAVEEQYYLAWPIVLLALLHLPRGILRPALVGAAILGIVARAAGAPAIVAHPLVLGSALAFVPLPRLPSLGLGAAPLVWLGRRSYGIYLWHFPVLWMLGDPWHETYPVRTAVLGVALTVALAASSFRWLEQPMLALKARLPRWTPAPLRLGWLPAVAVGAVTALVYLPVLRFGWIETYDDAAMLLNNGGLLSWDLRWAFTHLLFGHWMPLTWVTWTVDAHVWGAHAAGWHAENALLHAASAAVLYGIARRLLGGPIPAAFAALVWAVHPLRLESVAWISERKDCLSGLFVMLALWSYLRAVDRGRWPWAAFAWSLAADMSKSIAVVLVPFLLLLDWAVLHRQAWREKIPFVVTAIATATTAFVGIHVGITNLLPWSRVGLGPRLLHVAYSLVFYAKQTLWPSRMSYMIEYTWAPTLGQLQYPVSVVIVLLTIVLLVGHRSRVATAAVAAYAIAVLPQSGLFQNGAQLVANRYSYLAAIPLALLAGAGVARLLEHRQWRACALAGVIVAALIGVTNRDLPMWANDTTLQTYAADHEPTCIGCHQWAAVMAIRQGDVVKARHYLEDGLSIPGSPDWWLHGQLWGYGAVLEYLGDTQRAQQVFRAYLASEPAFLRGNAFEEAHLEDARIRLARMAGQ